MLGLIHGSPVDTYLDLQHIYLNGGFLVKISADAPDWRF
jgi:hypothetical protein